VQPQCTTPEEWRPVVGYEGWYEVSSLGTVRRLAPYNGIHAGHILKGHRNAKGYLRVALSRPDRPRSCRAVPIARLVAEAFIGPRPQGYQVNHKNGIKTDNRASNLEWCTGSENVRHAIRTGLSAPMPPTRAKVSADTVRRIRTAYPGKTTRELASQFHISKTAAWEIVAGRTWAWVT